MSTLSPLADEVQDRLEEPRSAGIFWSRTAEIYPALVEGMNEAMLITGDPELKLGTLFTSQPNKTWQTMPAGILVILRMQAPNGLPIKKESLVTLDRFQPGWQKDTGDTPLNWIPMGLNLFGVYPKLTQAINVTVAGIQIPVNEAPPFSGNETVPFPAEYNEGFVDYAAHVCRFKEAGAEFEASLAVYQRFLDRMMELSKFAYRRDALRFVLGPAGAGAQVTDVVKR